MRQTKKGAVPTRTPHSELAREVAQIEAGALSGDQFIDAPSAVPRANESKAVSIRLPVALLTILKGFARRRGVGYQVLLKQWLDDRVRDEYARSKQREGFSGPPEFPLVDRDPKDGRHFQKAA